MIQNKKKWYHQIKKENLYYSLYVFAVSALNLFLLSWNIFYSRLTFVVQRFLYRMLFVEYVGNKVGRGMKIPKYKRYKTKLQKMIKAMPSLWLESLEKYEIKCTCLVGIFCRNCPKILRRIFEIFLSYFWAFDFIAWSRKCIWCNFRKKQH